MPKLLEKPAMSTFENYLRYAASQEVSDILEQSLAVMHRVPPPYDRNFKRQTLICLPCLIVAAVGRPFTRIVLNGIGEAASHVNGHQLKQGFREP